MRAAPALLALAIAGALSAPAIAANPSHQPLLDGTVRFLQESQRPSGGFAPAGKKPSQSISAWVALALEGAGVNPLDQATCGIDVYSYLEGHFREGLQEELAWPEIATTAFERELLVVDAAGTNPHGFAGFDLVAEILGRQLADGAFPYVPAGRGEVNDTAFAILALSPVHAPAAEAAIQRGADWLITQQNDDGGWSWEVRGSPSEVDLTGAAIEALNAAGRANTEAQERGFEYLRGAQAPDGGFPALPSRERESNVASTAWAVQAIWSAGGNPETWLTGSGEASEEPLDYMESMQQPDGHIRWRGSSDLNGIWMTAYVAPAFAGQALPIPAVPRSAASAPPPGAAASPYPASCREPAPQGEAPRPGAEAPEPASGVIAGGGGNGAPLFSRPKPQSGGRTPGGARIVHNKDPRPTDHSRIRRGSNTKQPSGTESAEPARAEPQSREGAVVGAGSGSAGPGAGSAGRGQAATASGSAAAVDAGRESPGFGPRTGPYLPAPPASKAGAGKPAGREVSGVVVGGTGDAPQPGALAFGAPGLRSAGAGAGEPPWVAVGIGAGALLTALLGVYMERRREELVV
jgi:hypothetical protein